MPPPIRPHRARRAGEPGRTLRTWTGAAAILAAMLPARGGGVGWNAAARDAAALDAPARDAPAQEDSALLDRSSGADGSAAGGVRIRSFRGQDVRIIVRTPSAAPVPPAEPVETPRTPSSSGALRPAPPVVPADAVTRRDLDSLEARLLRAIDRRSNGSRPGASATVVAPGGPAVVPAPVRVETVLVERPAPDGAAAVPAPLPPAAAPPAADTAAPADAAPADADPAAPSEPEVLVREVERSILERGLFTAVDVIFEFNRSALLPRSHAVLDAVGRVMVRYPDLHILIEGHTDSVGSAAYNMKLSSARAEAARDYLLNAFPRISRDRLTTAGLGLTRPIADNSSETGRALNRRVEFRVLSGGTR